MYEEGTPDTYIDDIAPDVIGVLEKLRFFEKLDDHFCPPTISKSELSVAQDHSEFQRGYSVISAWTQMILMTSSRCCSREAQAVIARFCTSRRTEPPEGKVLESST